MSDIKQDAAKAKAKQDEANAANASKAPAGGKMSAAERAAMLRGDTSAAKEAAHEVGLRAYYQPGNFPMNKRGELLDSEGNFTAPEIHCQPVAIVHNDGAKSKIKNPDGSNKPFKQIIVKLLSDTFVVDDEENEVVVKKGSALMLMLTKGLEKVEEAAVDPQHLVEQWIRPLRKRDLDNGFKMWDWTVRSGNKTLRELPAQLPAAGAPAQQLGN